MIRNCVRKSTVSAASAEVRCSTVPHYRISEVAGLLGVESGAEVALAAALGAVADAVAVGGVDDAVTALELLRS